MKRICICLFVLLITVFAFAPRGMAVTDLPVVRIGIVTDGPWARYPGIVGVFKSEIETLAEGEFNVVFPEDRVIDGGWSIPGVTAALDTLLAAPDVDLVIAMGVVATHEVCHRKKHEKPVFGAFVVDDKIQKLPMKDGTSGVKNLNYINVQKSIVDEVKIFTEIAPFKKLTVIADDFELKALPDVAAHIRAHALEAGIEADIIGYEAGAAGTLEKLSPSTEAVFVTGLLRMSPEEFDKLVDGFIEKMLPSFSFWGMDDVKSGLLATMTPRANLEHLARSVAVNILEVLRGEDAGSLPVSFDGGQTLTINWSTAKAIEVYPKWDVLTTAQILEYKEVGTGRPLTLEGAVNESVVANLDLKALDRDVASGMEDVKKFRSSLLPQIAIGTEAGIIDSDRARASMGVEPEKTWTGSINAGQVLYSDKAWSGYTVQKHIQEALVENRETLRLDVMNTAAAAYLDVMRNQAVLNIQGDNLKLTRANLERSKVRVSVGVAGPEEVYRWESELANRMQEVLRAESALINARGEMNRIMDRPLTEEFASAEAGIQDPFPVIRDQRIFAYLETPRKIRVLQDFFMAESLELSPELKSINAQLAAQKRVLVFSKREFWLPTIELRGSVVEMFDKSGDGSEYPSGTMDVPDDTNWSVGVSATLPLFNGGERTAERRQALEEIEKLTMERAAAAGRVSKRVLMAMSRVRASYPGIRLSKDAAESSANNLQLVTDSYVRGVLSIIDLLDAQNLFLVAEQQSANAVYDFLTDLMDVQRAVGTFFLYAEEDERDAWFAKTEAYFQQ